jgi:tyrosine-protein kinase Etk/Wzc
MINNNGHNGNNGNKALSKKVVLRRQEELSLSKILQVMMKRKWILIGTVAAVITLVMLYNSFTPPVYEASVLLKKEKTEKSDARDELTRIISLQTHDEIETEMELVKTWDVLHKIIDELALFISIEQVVDHEGDSHEIKKNYADYKTANAVYPVFSIINIKPLDKNFSYYIEKTSVGNYALFDADTDELISSTGMEQDALFELPFMKFNFSWDALPGSKLYFNVNSYYVTMRDLRNNISLEQKLKTDVFQVSVGASSAKTAALIANTLTEKFRETRIDQQKQTIRYSYDFVDNNLEKIERELEEAEESLSQYKSANKVMDIDGSSRDLVTFMSNLEAEKLRTELELTEFKNKHAQMGAQLESDGFFDQTFLTPQGAEPTNSPFSLLMTQLSNLELERLELLQKRKESHPDVVKVDEQIATVKNKLSSYNSNTLTSYDIIINALDKKHQNIAGMMSKYESKMQLLPDQENRLAQLTRQRNVYSKMYTMLLDKREEMRMAELSKLQDIIVVDAAHEPMKPVSPRKTFNLMVGFLLSMVLGTIAVFFVELRSKRHISLDDVENDFPFTIFAIIPEYSKDLSDRIKSAEHFDQRFVTLMSEQDGFKESYRVLRAKIASEMENERKIMMFTSFEESTGKTTTIANLGISLALAKKKVLLVDCDLKKGSLSRLFDVPQDSPGVISYINKKVSSPYIYNKAVKTLDLLPSGGYSEHSSDFISSERMKALVELLYNSAYDYILFDTPPVTRVVDALVLGKMVKDAVLVVRPGYTFKESAVWGIQEMNQAKINIRGMVINAGQIERSTFKHRYGYGYGYKYGYQLQA